jgi:adenylate cyclase
MPPWNAKAAISHRYFSPNVVEGLSKNDEPLKQVRTQNVAVLFVDIVGFTAFANAHTPEEVVRALREFNALMEQEVFRYNGALDIYLGDGLMATFGTPFAGEADASNAALCAGYDGGGGSLERRTQSRRRGSNPCQFWLSLRVVVVGDIGLTCLEFAVIGSTVNVASRLEALTRPLDCALVASDDLVKARRPNLAAQIRRFDHLRRKHRRQSAGLYTRSQSGPR